MNVIVFAKGRNNSYDATGIFDGQNLTVKKDSVISNTIAAKINPIVSRLRSDKSVVSPEYIVLKDITFSSASTAANFVTGNISNGMRVWKIAPQKNLKNYLNELNE